MALETRIRIRRNPYHGYEVWLWGNGELTRRTFDNSIDLASKLAADCVSDRDIEDACDMFERLEWSEPEYPLGVVYVGEAVCDLGEPDPVYANVRPATVSPTRRIREYLRKSLAAAALAIPGFLLLVLGRFAWFKAAEWGWM